MSIKVLVFGEKPNSAENIAFFKLNLIPNTIIETINTL